MYLLNVPLNKVVSTFRFISFLTMMSVESLIIKT